jgi:hypothetical protein
MRERERGASRGQLAMEDYWSTLEQILVEDEEGPLGR